MSANPASRGHSYGAANIIVSGTAERRWRSRRRTLLAFKRKTSGPLIHRCNLYRLSFGLRQNAAEGHADYKHHGKHHSNHAIISWRAKPSHLLVQEFLVASVHLTSPFVVS
jgi:hypothetical protein